jgi:malto-oligosyltrehalose synthase
LGTGAAGARDAGTRIPVATYRLQLNKDFDFRKAESIVAYLGRLGVSDFYTSPLLRARAGSTHCYDIVDHNQLNQGLGTEEEFESLVEALRRRGMGLLLDIVPNHMAASSENDMWMSVQEYGPCSPYAGFFDIDWSPMTRGLKNRVLLPILTEDYSKALADARTRLAFDSRETRLFLVVNGGDRIPLAPRTYGQVLEAARNRLVEGDGEGAGAELGTLLSSLEALKEPGRLEGALFTRVHREGERLKKGLADLCRREPRVLAAISSAVAEFNVRDEQERRVGRFDSLLRAQFYKLSHWREASEKINYRRFVLVNDLVALRAERPEVFEESHRLILEMVAKGWVSGLRVDHSDGLVDPAAYFRRLRQGCATLAGRRRGATRDARERSPYIVAEKILSGDESLPVGWEIHGTTGYDFARDAGSLFVREENASRFDSIYDTFVGERLEMSELRLEARRQVLRRMDAELNALSSLLCRISRGLPGCPTLGPRLATKALTEAVVHFPVYRTYVMPGAEGLSNEDSLFISEAVRRGKEGADRWVSRALDLVEDVLLLRLRGSSVRDDVRSFVRSFQQITVPVAVKGDEDMAYYRYNRLASLNEVGGDPESFGMSVEEFHRRTLQRARAWPHAMLTTSTHDTKRSEDVRARIAALSEIPEEWGSSVSRWAKGNLRKKAAVGGRPAPDRNDEYLLYQTLVGVWPLSRPTKEGWSAFVERVVAYMIKAAREAGENTSWTDLHPEYESALEGFVRGILDTGSENRFLDDFCKSQERVAYLGMLGSLSQLLLKLTCPGVPDIYQGNETWDFSLVDPDNRRSVDFERRSGMLANLTRRVDEAGDDLPDLASGLLARWKDGLIKMYVTSSVLRCRLDRRELFERGAYVPLRCAGEMKGHLCAFAREMGEERCVVVAPRLFAGLANSPRPPVGEAAWRDTRLVMRDGSGGRGYRSLFTGRLLRPSRVGGEARLQVSDVLDRFPVALLLRE